MLKRIVPALAILLFSVAARAQMPAEPAFVMEARFGGGLSVAGSGGGGSSANLMFGVRLVDRLQIGIGFNVFHTSSIINVNNAVFSAQTTFTLNPTVAIDLLKARDNKVAWYGKIGLPLGVETHAVNNITSTSTFALGFDLGLGVRYCPHPNVAFGVEGGFVGTFSDPGGNASSYSVGLYGALVGTFYWGKNKGG